jgi:hypothetical protein
MKLTGTRTYLELRVGTFHSAEVILHVRRQDLRWFNRDDHPTAELFSVLQETVLPRMFANEIETSHSRQTGVKLPPPLGPGGVPIEVGETNLRQQQQQGAGKKRRRPLTKKQQAAELARLKTQAEDGSSAKVKDVYYAFGTSLQLAYRLEDDPKRKPTVTLLFRDDPQLDDERAKNKAATRKPSQTMQQLLKLSKRLVVWCYPYDSTAPMDADPPGGMLRPEMIPLADLFRLPQTNSDGNDEVIKSL